MQERYDLLLRLYDLNERYHDQKDGRAWIATTFYLTYAVALLTWLINPNNPVDGLVAIIALLVHTFLSVSAFLYVRFQFQMKSMSLESESVLRRQLDKLTDSDIMKLKNPKSKKPMAFDRLPIYSIIAMFFIMDSLLVVRCLSNRPAIDLSQIDVYLLVILIVVIVFLSVLFSCLLAICAHRSGTRIPIEDLLKQ